MISALQEIVLGFHVIVHRCGLGGGFVPTIVFSLQMFNAFGQSIVLMVELDPESSSLLQLQFRVPQFTLEGGDATVVERCFAVDDGRGGAVDGGRQGRGGAAGGRFEESLDLGGVGEGRHGECGGGVGVGCHIHGQSGGWGQCVVHLYVYLVFGVAKRNSLSRSAEACAWRRQLALF